MATVTPFPPARKPVTHYAILTVGGVDLEGIARLVPGGYAFTADGERRTRLAAYNDPNLTLLGRYDLADTQLADDLAAGGYAAIACGR